MPIELSYKNNLKYFLTNDMLYYFQILLLGIIQQKQLQQR